jgi:hypothetical protein
LTRRLPTNDNTTINHAEEAERIWPGENPEEVFQSMEKIRPGIGDRKGRRALQQHASHVNKRGGKRVRQPEKDKIYWIHPDARSAYELKLETSIAMHAGTQQSTDSDAQVGEGEGEDSLYIVFNTYIKCPTI